MWIVVSLIMGCFESGICTQEEETYNVGETWVGEHSEVCTCEQGGLAECVTAECEDTGTE